MSIGFLELYKSSEAVSAHEHFPYVLVLINVEINKAHGF